MADASFTGSLFHGQLRTNAERLLWLGFAMIVLGVLAIAFPVSSTLVAAFLVGWLLLISGCISLIGSFSIHGTGPFFGSLLLALLSIAGGAFLLFNPLAGTIALTLVVGVLFMFQGAAEIAFASELHPHSGWRGMVISGVISIVVAILIAAGWPQDSTVMLGILLGVNFISTGVAYVLVSRAIAPV